MINLKHIVHTDIEGEPKSDQPWWGRGGSARKLTKRDGAVSQKVTENYWGGGGPPKSYQQWWREGRVGHKVTKSDAGGGSQKVMGRVVGLCSQPKVTPYLLSSIDLPVRHKQYLCELLITRTGLFEAPSALLCNQCLLPQAVSKSQFKTKSKTCQPAFCLCGYSIQQISLREARTLFRPLTFPDLWTGI